MEELKTYPMALFTPIVEIAETTPETDTKENLPKEMIKNEAKNQFVDQVEFLAVEKIKTEQPDEDLNTFKETIEKMNQTSKRKRGRPKKIIEVCQLEKPKRKYTKKGETEAPKKKPRKQSSPKKKPLEVIENYPEDDLLISPDEHFDLTKLIKCPLCKDDKEWNLNEVKQHYKDNHPGKRLRISRFFGETHPCDICTKEFKSPGSLRDHVETHNNYYYCDICNHSTKKILDHVIHLRVHNPLGFFQCLMCDLTTVDINQITDHVTNHQDVMKYWCDTCKKSFTILQHFQEHENYHTGLKPFDCEFCGKCFLYSRFLHAHKVNMHKELMNCPSTYQCVICHKIYQHRNSLKLHMNSHTGNFAICDVCGKTLSSKEKLKFHLRTHTGYKPYSCQYCGKCFTKKPILVEHVRVHTGEKPYICDYCAKGFSQRSSLVIHMRGHTGEKPYVCHFCGKGFVAKAMLNIHLKSCKGLFHVAKMEF